MDLSPTNLFLSMAIGSVGFGIFLYGKKQHRGPQLLAGIALMVYPYFVASVGWMVAVGAAVIAGLWLAVRAGL